MNEFDQFIKRHLKVQHYIRYADDFVIFSYDRNYLKKLIPQLESFLNKKLKLKIHPQKIGIKTVSSGIDFLGWTHFPTHRVLRTTTKKRLFKRIAQSPKEPTRQSYLGLIKHGDTFKIKRKFENLYSQSKRKKP